MKVISLINMKGGVAKTTMAVNIADFLANVERKSVLLIDVDPQFNATQCILGGEEYIEYIKNGGYTIHDIFDGSNRVVTSTVSGYEEVEATKFEDIKPLNSTRGFDFIPGALKLFKLEMAPGSGREYRLKNYIKSLEQNYEYVIIDSPPTPSVWMSSALLASDYYLIPVKPDPISTTGIELLQGIIAEKSTNYGVNWKCCGIVLTMVERRSNSYLEAKEYFEGKKRWKDYLYNRYLLKRVQIARGQLNNQFIRDIDDSELKAEFSAIVKELVRRTS